MKDRCLNPNSCNWTNYGGRGITVCDRWKDSFSNFYEDMGPRPSTDHSIDRKDNDKGYSKENCRWVTHDVQAHNRGNNVYYEHNGERKLLLDWCAETGMNYNTVYTRLRRGWSFEKAITVK